MGEDGKREVRNLGKPVEVAAFYYEQGADEITFLNITGKCLSVRTMRLMFDCSGWVLRA